MNKIERTYKGKNALGSNTMPSKDAIYVSKGTPETIYGYIRGTRGGDVGFSVLDTATSQPDFSGCGTFWLKPEDFFKVFEYYGPKELPSGVC